MTSAAPIDGGYFAKIVMLRPEYPRTPPISEVLSVSCCLSAAPAGWMNRWRHNALGWFNTIDDARAAMTPDPDRYRLFAYRITPQVFRDGVAHEQPLPADVRPEPIPASFLSHGFDVVSRSRDDSLAFECSPLSCNGLASE